MDELCDPSFALCDMIYSCKGQWMSCVIHPLLCVITKRGLLERKKCERGDDVEDIVSPFGNQLLRRDLAHCYDKMC